ncbi:MAG: metallophosphoesterase family protein [Bacteroidota bacterium]
MNCIFVSDLHGKKHLYKKLFDEIQRVNPDMVLLGGDLFPHGYFSDESGEDNFITDFLIPEFSRLKEIMKEMYPSVLLILGNDDPRINESEIDEKGKLLGLWYYLHSRKIEIEDHVFYGYSFIPPTPFGLKDWEKYDVSRFVDPGCIHPYEGMRTVNPDYDPEYSNIKEDLESLTANEDMSKAIFLFHSPPYNTPLDRAGLDGEMIDYVPLDVHVGSIAIQRFIEEKQPLLTLHGHIHEAYSITGEWRTKIGNTHAFNASYDKDKLCVVLFEPKNLDKAEHYLI